MMQGKKWRTPSVVPDFYENLNNPVSRQVRRACERRKDKMPLVLKVKNSAYGTKDLRIA